MNARKIIARTAENWPAKVLSLGLAIFLFVFHRMSTLENRFFLAPLNLETNGSLVPSSSYPQMIRVSLRGEANSIFPVMEGDIEVYVDIDKYNIPGAYTVPVQWRKKGAAHGTEPLQITVDPMEITFSLDYKISKVVPLLASLRGQVETGYTMTSYSLNPAQVIVEGPAELIWDISEVYTDTIVLDGRRSDFSLTVNAVNREPFVAIRGNTTSEFQGTISELIPVRNITNVPIVITGLMEGFTGELEIKTGSIRLEGRNQDAVNEFEPSSDFLKVDCSGINRPGTYLLKVLTGTARNVILRAEPGEVKIQISPAARHQTSDGEYRGDSEYR